MKAAMLSFSRLVADLHAKDGIRCNAVTPGPTATDAWLGDGRARRPAGRARRGAGEGRRRAGRSAGSPSRSEIAAVIVFLCSDRASVRDRRGLERRRRHRPDHHLSLRREAGAGSADTLDVCLRTPDCRRRRSPSASREHEERALSPLAVRSYETRGRASTRGRVRRPHAVPARPRPHRPLEAVPAAEGQDAGLHRPGRRPLPHAHDPHARDDRDRARRRARAAAERGPRPRRSASATTRATRRSATPARRRSTRLLRERFGGGFRHNEQSLRIAERLNLTHEVRDGILTHTGDAGAGDARGQDRAHRRPRRLHQPRHRRRDPLRDPRARATCRATRSSCSARPGSTRIDTLVHDLVETSARRRRHRPERRDRRGDALAARVHVRARLPRPARRAPSTSARARRSARIFDALAERGDEPDEIIEFIAGMTDRFALDVR